MGKFICVSDDVININHIVSIAFGEEDIYIYFSGADKDIYKLDKDQNNNPCLIVYADSADRPYFIHNSIEFMRLLNSISSGSLEFAISEAADTIAENMPYASQFDKDDIESIKESLRGIRSGIFQID